MARQAPPSPSTKPGDNPGYAEPAPRDRDDARQPHPRKPRNPDEGGMERDPDSTSDAPQDA